MKTNKNLESQIPVKEQPKRHPAVLPGQPLLSMKEVMNAI
jgi:hypothetical protein